MKSKYLHVKREIFLSLSKSNLLIKSNRYFILIGTNFKMYLGISTTKILLIVFYSKLRQYEGSNQDETECHGKNPFIYIYQGYL